jgi:hypothetical protein
MTTFIRRIKAHLRYTTKGLLITRNVVEFFFIILSQRLGAASKYRIPMVLHGSG